MTKDNDKQFTCAACGDTFTMTSAPLDRFPGWKPSQCQRCYSGRKRKPASKPVQGNLLPTDAPAPARPRPTAGALARDTVEDGPLRQALDQVLDSYHEGPREGVFTDGASHGNPGPGGWGAVYVREDKVVAERYGRSPDTTNNRMELRALMAAFEMIDPDEDITIWSDSQLCVNTINQWAAGWKRRGWKRKGGAIKNLDLVRPLYELACTRPRARLTWIKAHAGKRWNEYADTLADPDLQ